MKENLYNEFFPRKNFLEKIKNAKALIPEIFDDEVPADLIYFSRTESKNCTDPADMLDSVVKLQEKFENFGEIFIIYKASKLEVMEEKIKESKTFKNDSEKHFVMG